jgi:NADH-quinone oxidoreductase subunit M
MITGILLLVPLAFLLVILFMQDEKIIRLLAIAGSVVEFLFALYGLFIYLTQCHCQWMIDAGWIGSLHISLRFGVDDLSLVFVLLTVFIVPVILISRAGNDCSSRNAFRRWMLVLETALIGLYTASDGMLFIFFWGVALVSANRVCSESRNDSRNRFPRKFFISALLSILLLLSVLVYIYFRSPAPHSFEIIYLYAAHLSATEQGWLFPGFVLAFVLTLPILPFQSWILGTYTKSPSFTRMLVTGIVLKMGIYGVIRFLLPICPVAVKEWGWPALAISIAGPIFYSVLRLRKIT